MNIIGNKKLVLVILLLGLIIVALVVLRLRTPDTEIPKEPIKIFQPDKTSTPTVPQKYLKVVGTEPANLKLTKIPFTGEVTIVFEEPIKEQTLDYQIQPPQEVETRLDETRTRLSFRPTTYWSSTETVEISIKKNLQSVSETVLAEDFKVQFKIGIPPSEGL